MTSNKIKVLTRSKLKINEQIFALKVKTESNTLGTLKTILVITFIALQLAILVTSYIFMIALFRWYLTLSLLLTTISCLHVLSSDHHGQAKATWILFLVSTLGFGYIFYFASDKRILLSRMRKKYNKIFNKNATLQEKTNLSNIEDKAIKTTCEYLQNAGNFKTFYDSKTTYYPSGNSFFDEILDNISKAKSFIFLEFFIISDGVLLNRILDILSKKVANGVDVRIIYDDMGSHGTLKRKTKKRILNLGIKLQSFNRFMPVFNLALNLRNHRKIIIIDGLISFTGGANLADEYINEKRLHGYWKDSGIKIEGNATDNFTIAFLNQWHFLTDENIDVKKYINKSNLNQVTNEICVPFVSGPHYEKSIAHNAYLSQIANAKEKLYIMTPYFISDETITNILINRASSGVDVRIFLPDIADKKYVYVVSRSNAEKLLKYGVKIFVMKSCFVHSKVLLTENSAIVGSINIDLRSFYQQFESGIILNHNQTLKEIEKDFEYVLSKSEEITNKNKKRRHLHYRILAGFLNLFSPFM